MQLPGNVMKVDFECLDPASARWPTAPGRRGRRCTATGCSAATARSTRTRSRRWRTSTTSSTARPTGRAWPTADVPNVATILADLSNFPTLADRVQQGMLNFLYLGRLMIHPQGLGANPAFQTADGKSLFDTRRLYYDGNSQGGIIGGALTAVAPDFTRATLGVLGMNYSTLLDALDRLRHGDEEPSPTPIGPAQRLRVRLPAVQGLPAAQRAPADLRAHADAVGSRRARRLRAAHDRPPVSRHAAARGAADVRLRRPSGQRTTRPRSRRGRSARACSSRTCCARGGRGSATRGGA